MLEKFIPDSDHASVDYRGISRDRKYFASYLKLHQARFLEILSYIQNNYDRKDIKILDVGIGYGFVAKTLVERGYEVMGLEHPAARSTIELAGLTQYKVNVEYCDLEKEEISLEGHKFDVIIYSEIFEHICLPGDIQLRNLKKLLNTRGNIILTTPNFASLRNRINLLFGRNVTEKFPPKYPHRRGHVREYTLSEIEEAAELQNMKILLKRYSRIWDSIALDEWKVKNWKGKLFEVIFTFSTLIVPSFSSNLFVILEKSDD